MVSRLVDFSLIIVATFVVIYAFSLFKQLHQTTTKQQKELVFTRTQILNASHSSEDMIKTLIEKLKGMRIDNVAHQIVEVEDLDVLNPAESLILDRLGEEGKKTPSRIALLTAEALGIPHRNVVYKELEDNYQGISLTIVIGHDGGVLFSDI